MKLIKSIISNTFIALVSIVIALICVEFILKFTPYKNIKRGVDFHNELTPSYITKDEEIGYDITKNFKNGVHKSLEFNYEIFSNSLGCFDYEKDMPDNYALVMGDSYTWGFTPLDKKWTSYIEDKSGISMLKCGVSGYGTRQELIKTKRVIKKLGKTPKYLILMYCANDMNDDFHFPHINKGGIKNIDLEQGIIHFHPKQQNNKKKSQDNNIKVENKQSNFKQKLRELRYKSVIYNIYMVKVKTQIRLWKQQFKYGDNMPSSARGKYRVTLIDYLEKNDELDWYSDLIKYHKQSLRNFINYAKQIDTTLILIDPFGSLDNTTFSDVIKDKTNGKFYYYNLDKDYPVKDQSTWITDGHWNVEGNQEAGKFIYQHLKEIGVFQ